MPASLDRLASALEDGDASVAQLRGLLAEEMRLGAQELAKRRSGRVTVAFAPGLLAALPVAPRVRVDPDACGERAWLIVAAAVGAAAAAGGGELTAGGADFLVLGSSGADAELAALAFEENVRGVDRARPRAVVLPEGVLAAGGEPILNPQLEFAQRVALQGSNPADAVALESLEDALVAPRPHDDPDPAARIARRILQRLDGMGKWGGYHTEFAHLGRGFAGHERESAFVIGERLLAAGLLAEKQSVGQRHVFLNPRRAGDIRRMIESGQRPPDLELPVL